METFKELLLNLGTSFMKLLRKVLEWFLELDLINKIIVVNGAVAFFAIVLPVGRYYIFESWFYLNNPIAVYLIGIVILMIGTIYIPAKAAFIIRLIVNLWFFLWLMYITFSHTISHAPYELSSGYYFSIAAPLIYIAASSVSYFLNRD